jgi:hypothetical protein
VSLQCAAWVVIRKWSHVAVSFQRARTVLRPFKARDQYSPAATRDTAPFVTPSSTKRPDEGLLHTRNLSACGAFDASTSGQYASNSGHGRGYVRRAAEQKVAWSSAHGREGRG